MSGLGGMQKYRWRAGALQGGHDLTRADRWSTDFGRAQLIFRMEDGYLAASERRTDGQAVGF